MFIQICSDFCMYLHITNIHMFVVYTRIYKCVYTYVICLLTREQFLTKQVQSCFLIKPTIACIRVKLQTVSFYIRSKINIRGSRYYCMTHYTGTTILSLSVHLYYNTSHFVNSFLHVTVTALYYLYRNTRKHRYHQTILRLLF